MSEYLEADSFRLSFGAYKLETHEIVERFLSAQTNFPASIAALDSAFAALIPDLDDLCELRAVMLANNETVMKKCTSVTVFGNESV